MQTGHATTSAALASDERCDDRYEVFVRGVVQGVGFRPFVYGCATAHGLAGFVRNAPDGVLAEVEGPRASLDHFVEELRGFAAQVARVDDVVLTSLPRRGERGFTIAPSASGARSEDRFFAPDIATCDACVRELFDPANRRHRYPFINCACCGPRMTIIEGAPYDRARTTMASFPLCALCAGERADPGDRRFHAEPIACATCGPRLRALDGNGAAIDVDPLSYAVAALRAGQVIAVKGIGGYHLACDAANDVALRALRERKRRPDKPFAIMVRDLDAARELCVISSVEAEALCSHRRPVVLLRRRKQGVGDAVAPRSPWLGVMLAYSPLHHLMLADHGGPLVMTSGNRSDEPIACDDDDAVQRLRGIADGFLVHDRAIRQRCDDSIARVPAGSAAPLVLRRARGFAPEPVALPFTSRPILALGGHLKNTFAIGRGRHAFLSHHLGDLGERSAYLAYADAIARYASLFAFKPEVIAHDLHPTYATTEHAQVLRAAHPAAELIAIQHHAAHVASCMVERAITGPVIGVAFDGTGYGDDGVLWGGEFLVGDLSGFRRAAHFRACRLPGGERAIREPWRLALAHLMDSAIDEPLVDVTLEARRVVARMIDTGLQSPWTTSVGRLFDAVAAILGVRSRASFEAQAAIELEALAMQCDTNESYPLPIADDVIDTRPLVQAIVEDRRRSTALATIARKFHTALADCIARVVAQLHERTGLSDVVLTGGVFQNAVLAASATTKLFAAGFRVHTHHAIPPNDGGLALGQLALAAHRTGRA